MKMILVGLTVLGLTSSALAVTQADLDTRIQLLTAKFTAMQERPDRRIPADILNRAQGIVLMDQTKAGFFFAYQGGRGVALTRNASGNWGPAAFVSANEGSFGFQGGGERDFLVILYMDPRSTQELAWSTKDFGGGARGTAGNGSAGVSDQMTSPRQTQMLVYGDHTGLYGGAYVKGGGITSDKPANVAYYHQPFTAYDILFGNKVAPTPAAATLDEEISKYSQQAEPQREHEMTPGRNVTVPASR